MAHVCISKSGAGRKMNSQISTWALQDSMKDVKKHGRQTIIVVQSASTFGMVVGGAQVERA